MDMERQSGDMFRKLFAYIQGDNEEGVVMKMTAPVFSFRHFNTDNMVDKVTMCFWINQTEQVLKGILEPNI